MGAASFVALGMTCASAAMRATGLPESPVDDGIHQHLDWVAVCL